MTEEIRAMSDSEKKKEDWMNSKWRQRWDGFI
jgi:hypothetical protein